MAARVLAPERSLILLEVFRLLGCQVKQVATAYKGMDEERGVGQKK